MLGDTKHETPHITVILRGDCPYKCRQRAAHWSSQAERGAPEDGDPNRKGSDSNSRTDCSGAGSQLAEQVSFADGYERLHQGLGRSNRVRSYRVRSNSVDLQCTVSCYCKSCGCKRW